MSDDAIWGDFSGPNAAYLLDLYDRYRSQPESVPDEAREFFERSGPPPAALEQEPTEPGGSRVLPEIRPPSDATAGNGSRRQETISPLLVAGAVGLATAIRAYGYRAARLDPLGSEPPGDSALRAETHGIHEEELAALPASIVGGPVAESAGNALVAIRELRRIYQGTSGYEFEHVSNAGERNWLRNAVEGGQFSPPKDPIDELNLLKRLTEVGAFERFLHTVFPGQTRFSLEGLGMMIPMLDEIIGAAAEAGARSVLVGMAHRGRLNVLAHVLGKPYEQLIGAFMGASDREHSVADSSDDGWTGDVKYHLGARKAYRGGREVEMLVYLAPNPSHLEWVDAVVVGMDRASDERRDIPGQARQDELASQAILIHGDASFPGQGIVAETLNLSRLPGYRVGGTLHIITNNQLGFTTPPSSGRSTLFASDLAKGFEIPIIHVNADDPEACIAAARLAHAYRERFRQDVVIDLIGYRRWGHNEGDEPTFTQPRLYAQIAQHPRVREIWAQELERRGLITVQEADAMLQAAVERLHGIRRKLQEQLPKELEGTTTSGLEAGGAAGGLGRPGVASAIETAVPLDRLAALNEELYRMPPGFHLHPKLERPFGRRRGALAPSPRVEGVEGVQDAEPRRVEWAHAEALAFASILADGTPVRLTGQDAARGTFSQRHLVLHDVETGLTYCPLQQLRAARASFEVWDSPLSEQATLAFEFGYSVQSEALVLWEAQYGDFVNVPQAVIDQFIVSARSKWGQYTGMVMLLPHGYEGQGPEHSSARLERFLQLVAEDNLRIANLTTAAQYFHILRRQKTLLSLDPRPLILLTPKSLLRNPLAASEPEDLGSSRFEPVLGDIRPEPHPEAVRRLVMCSGKVFYDLVAAREKLVQQKQPEGNGLYPPSVAEVALVRVEELYPFPAAELAARVESFPNLEEVVWLQEEPRNMGAWTWVAPRIRDLLRDRLPLVYIGRTRRASPAEGSHHWHVREQERLVQAAFRLGPPIEEEAVVREVEYVD
jgi:2-oxoglutarate dehydrogenase E1 component